jgi:hypothetical protein
MFTIFPLNYIKLNKIRLKLPIKSFIAIYKLLKILSRTIQENQQNGINSVKIGIENNSNHFANIIILKNKLLLHQLLK